MLRVLLSLLLGLALAFLGEPGPVCDCARGLSMERTGHACCGKKALGGEGDRLCRGQCEHRLASFVPPSPVDRALAGFTDGGGPVALLPPAPPALRGAWRDYAPRARGARGPPGLPPPLYLTTRSLRC